jgi:NADH-quinone oxidoreductase subunit G
LNPDVNDYWMCDIGRFDYHWIEGGNRLQQPLVRDQAGAAREVTWHDLFPRLRDRLSAATSANADGLRFLLSAHASHEELFLFRRLAEALRASGITVSWRYLPKSQPDQTKFRVPAVDAPNVDGARKHGLVPGRVGNMVDTADVSELRQAVESGSVSALYVFDPGPDGSIGETAWIVEARGRGLLPLLIVQGILLTDLARVADFVLPGASYVEKEASYTNDQGRLQAAARVIPPPGDAMEDWQVIIKLARALDVPLDYANATRVRADMAAKLGDAGLSEIATLTFGRPLAARHWLQASNPSERWKWDFMFRDLPPVKGTVDPLALPSPPGAIPLREVKG